MVDVNDYSEEKSCAYKDEEYLINEIMGQNRHQFIYGHDNEEKKLLLKKIDEEYIIMRFFDLLNLLYEYSIDEEIIGLFSKTVETIYEIKIV